jgi:hypothetical protein
MTRNIEKIQKDIEEYKKLYNEILQNVDKYNSLEKYQLALAPYQKKLDELSRELRMIMPYELSELPNYGDVMALNDFIETVKSGGFIDYDGFGSYVKDGKETNITIYPSDVKYNAIRKEFDTIIWFNK